jgi:hypothetical protein
MIEKLFKAILLGKDEENKITQSDLLQKDKRKQIK